MGKISYLIDEELSTEITQGEDRSLEIVLTEDDEAVNLTGATEVKLVADHKLDGIIRLASTSPTFKSTGVSLASGEIQAPGHGLADGQKVQLTTSGTLPTGLALATDYYILRLTKDVFQLSATLGGTAIIPTAVGSGTHTMGFTPLAITTPKEGTVTVTLSDTVTSAMKDGPKQPMELHFTIGAITRIVRMEKSLTVFVPLT